MVLQNNNMKHMVNVKSLTMEKCEAIFSYLVQKSNIFNEFKLLEILPVFSFLYYRYLKSL